MPEPAARAKSDTWSSFGRSRDSDTTSCRAKEEERASFGEKRRDGILQVGGFVDVLYWKKNKTTGRVLLVCVCVRVCACVCEREPARCAV